MFLGCNGCKQSIFHKERFDPNIDVDANTTYPAKRNSDKWEGCIAISCGSVCGLVYGIGMGISIASGFAALGGGLWGAAAGNSAMLISGKVFVGIASSIFGIFLLCGCCSSTSCYFKGMLCPDPNS